MLNDFSIFNLAVKMLFTPIKHDRELKFGTNVVKACIYRSCLYNLAVKLLLPLFVHFLTAIFRRQEDICPLPWRSRVACTSMHLVSTKIIAENRSEFKQFTFCLFHIAKSCHFLSKEFC